MPCCKHFGNFPHNQDVVISIPSPEIGKYIFWIDFNGAVIRREYDNFYAGDLVIEGPFNENYTYTFTIENPNGDLVEIDDCTQFTFKTFININSACNGNLCED
jgi:hypothetical protein